MGLTVGDVMSKQVRCCQPSDSLAAAARIMWDHDVGCVVVVDQAMRPLGMVTDRDACMASYTRGAAPGEISVELAMSKAVFCCAPSDPLERAEEVMRKHQVRRLPVVGREGGLVGVLSLSDIARVGEGALYKRGGASPEAIEATLAAISRPRGLA